MKIKFLNDKEFIYLNKKFQIEEIWDYYSSHMMRETISYFNISKDCLIKIFKYYNKKKTLDQKRLSKSRSWYMKSEEVQKKEIEKRRKGMKEA